MKLTILVLELAAVSTVLAGAHEKCRQECGGGIVSVAQKDDGSISPLIDYDPTDPDERAKADEKIVAFLREHTGHCFGDDFAAAGFSTNESTVSFSARKPFGIFDVVEVSQLTRAGGAVRPTGKIQTFCFRPSRKYGATNFTYKTAREMMMQTGRDLAKCVDLQETYFDPYVNPGDERSSLKKKLDWQKAVRKPYPNIKMEPRFRNAGLRHRDLSHGSLRRPGGIDSTASEWLFSLNFDLSKQQNVGEDKSEDEIIIEWRDERRQFVEIEKCYSHGIFVDASKTNQWDAVAPIVADIHFMTAFKQLTGFEIGQGCVSGIGVITNISMDYKTQEVDMPVRFCAAKKEQLLFKNGRLYGVCVQVPFCEASRMMEKRSVRIVEADRDGVWNEMDAMFGVGQGCIIGMMVDGRLERNKTGPYYRKRYVHRRHGWHIEAVPMPKNIPERIDLFVTFDVYHKELRDGTQGVIVDVGRLRSLNDGEKRSYNQIRKAANELEANALNLHIREFASLMGKQAEEMKKSAQIRKSHKNTKRDLTDKLNALDKELDDAKREIEQAVDDHEKVKRIEKLERVNKERAEMVLRLIELSKEAQKSQQEFIRVSGELKSNLEQSRMKFEQLRTRTLMYK